NDLFEEASGVMRCGNNVSIPLVWERNVAKQAFADGSQFWGQFKNCKKEGFGTLIYSNGDSWRGEFRDGKRQGLGTMVCGDGSSVDLQLNLIHGLH
ncbi:MAG: hypothetical protein GY712_05995, partial [Oceanicoccus sp.]|nr:hypothetical protein [Oceanicoccus sp.]